MLNGIRDAGVREETKRISIPRTEAEDKAQWNGIVIGKLAVKDIFGTLRAQNVGAVHEVGTVRSNNCPNKISYMK